MTSKFLVRQREGAGLGKPNMYTRKRSMKWTPWRTVKECETIEEARELRVARSVGLFQRVVFWKGTIVIQSDGFQEFDRIALATGKTLPCANCGKPRWYAHGMNHQARLNLPGCCVCPEACVIQGCKDNGDGVCERCGYQTGG